MSRTLKYVTDLVRSHMKDYDTGEPIFPQSLLRTKVDNVARNDVGPRLRLGTTYTAAAIAISPSTNRYQLPGTLEYTQVRQALLDSLGRDISILTVERLQQDWYGITTPNNVKGDPYHLAFYEDTSQSVWMWLYPWPRKVDSISLLASVLPDDLTADDDVIPFDDQAIGAIGYQVAAELIAMASPNNLTSLNLNPESAKLYLQRADALVRESNKRHARLRGAGHTRRTRR